MTCKNRIEREFRPLIKETHRQLNATISLDTLRVTLREPWSRIITANEPLKKPERTPLLVCHSTRPVATLLLLLLLLSLEVRQPRTVGTRDLAEYFESSLCCVFASAVNVLPVIPEARLYRLPTDDDSAAPSGSCACGCSLVSWAILGLGVGLGASYLGGRRQFATLVDDHRCCGSSLEGMTC